MGQITMRIFAVLHARKTPMMLIVAPEVSMMLVVV